MMTARVSQAAIKAGAPTGVRTSGAVVTAALASLAVLLCWANPPEAGVLAEPTRVAQPRVASAFVEETTPRLVLGGEVLYDNTGNPDNFYYVGQQGHEAIDDLHLISGSALDSVVFEYYDPATTGNPFSAIVRIYDNPGGLDLNVVWLAGPYTASGLTEGRGVVSVPLLGTPEVGRDVWVGVQFTSMTAGLILNNVPAIGSSHDLYVEDGGFYWFGGHPKANFGLRVVQGTGTVDVTSADARSVRLEAPQPNPFRAETMIRFVTPRAGHVRLDVLDLAGRLVRTLADGAMDPGSHAANWSGRDRWDEVVAPGMYFVRLEAEATAITRKIVFSP